MIQRRRRVINRPRRDLWFLGVVIIVVVVIVGGGGFGLFSRLLWLWLWLDLWEFVFMDVARVFVDVWGQAGGVVMDLCCSYC